MPFNVPFVHKTTYTAQEIDTMFGGLGGGSGGYAKRSTVVVAPAGWTSVAFGAGGYPSSEDIGTVYYADLAHNLNSTFAVVIAAAGADNFIITNFQFQQRIDDNTLRIWLAYSPPYTVLFLVAS